MALTSVAFTATLPKVKLAELTLRRGAVGAIPVPVRLTTAVLLEEESLWMETCPVTAAAEPGVRLTVRAIDCPGWRVSGKVAPASLNPDPLTVAELTVRSRFPVDVRVSERVAVEFIVTFPKSRFVALTDRLRDLGRRPWP